MKKKFGLKLADRAAERLLKRFGPVVERVEVAGSVRRRRPMVSDIELVVLPLVNGDLFGDDTPLLEPIYKVIHETWPGVQISGHRKHIKVHDILGPQRGMSLDLFIVTPPAQWGSIYAIRTGSANFIPRVMQRFIDRGYRHRQGHLVEESTGVLLPTPTERAFFGYAGMAVPPPEERE